MINKYINFKSQGAFTLVEVMVVVVILGILAAVVVPRVMSRPDEARVIRAEQDIRALEAALKLYRLDNFTYPDTDQGLLALIEKPSDLPPGAKWKGGGYLDKMPVDPWGNEYLYLYPGANAEFDLYSLGADSLPDGEGVNADIGNWTLQ